LSADQAMMKSTAEARFKRNIGPLKARPRLSSVANAILLFKLFSDEKPEIGISEIAKRLGLAKSTAYRIASTLVQASMLEQNAKSKKYGLGLGLWELGSRARRRMYVSDEARPFIRALAKTTGESISLAARDHLAAIYLMFLEGRHAVRSSSKIGIEIPLHCTAVGKILLAFQPMDLIEKVIASGLQGFTSNTITHPRALFRELTKIRVNGYAIENQEYEYDRLSVAAPIHNHADQVVAAIGITGNSKRMKNKILHSYALNVRSITDAISQRLGYQQSTSQVLRRISFGTLGNVESDV
jgi:IclR family KDG regulon transcriptional repressor